MAPLPSRLGLACHVVKVDACLAPAKLSSHDVPWARAQLLPWRIISCREGRAYRSSLLMAAQARMALGVSRDGRGTEDIATDSQGRFYGLAVRTVPFDTSLGFSGGTMAPTEAAGGHLWTLVRALHPLVLKPGKKPASSQVVSPPHTLPPAVCPAFHQGHGLFLGIPIFPFISPSAPLAALESPPKSRLSSYPTASPWSRALLGSLPEAVVP